MRRDIEDESFHPAWWRSRKVRQPHPDRTEQETPLSKWLQYLLRKEFHARRHLLDRVLVVVFAIATGLLLVGLTYLSGLASRFFDALQHIEGFGPYLALAWTPIVTVLIVWWTNRFALEAAGSGIPQVIRALEEDSKSDTPSHLVSLKISLQKIALVAAGLLGGLSIGREGPAVQIGAGVMQHSRRWLSRLSNITRDDLVVAGAAAGIAAAFNTPLGGIIFALEKLSGERSKTRSALMIACIVAAGLISISFFGNETYFGHLNVQRLGWDLFLPGVLVAVFSGIAGGVFSRLVIASLTNGNVRPNRWRAKHPLVFAGSAGLAVAVIGLVTANATSGTGYASTQALLEGNADFPPMYTWLKFCATWLSSWTGVPGGIFAPSLAIGAGIGHDIATLFRLGGEISIPLVALGMVGFLAATTQGPITAFIIVMEMISGYSMVLSLMGSAMLASRVSRLISKPLYAELAKAILIHKVSPSPLHADTLPKKIVQPT